MIEELRMPKKMTKSKLQSGGVACGLSSRQACIDAGLIAGVKKKRKSRAVKRKTKRNLKGKKI